MTLRELLTKSVGAETSSDDSPLSQSLHRLSTAERDLWFVAVAAMLVDVTLTVHGLQLGLRELNPIGRSALETVGIMGLYGLKAGALAVGICCRPLLPTQYRAIIPLALAIPPLVAVVINATLITSVSL